MAYVVHLWNAEPLQSLAAAESRLHELRGVRTDAQNPRFEKLIRALTELYPYGDNDEEIDSIWSEALEASPGSAILTLGLRSDEIEVGLPAILAAAREHDLIVLDSLGGEVNFPSGEAFGPNGPLHYAPEKPVLPGSPTELPNTEASEEFLVTCCRALLRAERNGAFLCLKRAADFRVACIDHDEDVQAGNARLELVRNLL